MGLNREKILELYRRKDYLEKTFDRRFSQH
jgi:transposase